MFKINKEYVHTRILCILSVFIINRLDSYSNMTSIKWHTR